MNFPAADNFCFWPHARQVRGLGERRSAATGPGAHGVRTSQACYRAHHPPFAKGAYMTSSSSNPSNYFKLLGWPTWPWPPFLGQTVPAGSNSFDQPINPDWAFWNLISVTEQNSSAPGTERDIVANDSYGRQLGKVIDALVELIDRQPKETQQKTAIKELVALHDKIEKIKIQSAAHRLDRIAADLATLRKGDQTEYQRLVQKLRDALPRATRSASR